ncbi:HAMP domain-containing histidine kinase [Mycolicibacterium rhodesiae]|nr:HAMP domain-containing histidine kinase [Mycolicibacterium rhodesiae]
MLRRAGRSAALRSAVLLAAALVVIGLLVYLVDSHRQRQATDRELADISRIVDDVTDPPPGMALALRSPNGTVSLSANAPPGATSFLDLPTGYKDVSDNGVDYRLLVQDNKTGRVAALVDQRPRKADEQRLLASLAGAEILGMLGVAAALGIMSRRAVRPLADALALQRRFVADASHELRAPLTVLHTRAQMLALEATHEPISEPMQREIAGLVADTRALGEVVNDLLVSAERAAHPERWQHLDLVALAKQVRDSYRAHAAAAGVGLEVVSDSRTVPLTGSGPALRRAVSALVDNAIAHERPGGRVELRIDHDDSAIRLAVADSGIGLNPDQTQQLFTRFAHGPTRPDGQRRYGIGLALVQEIVAAHAGRLVVEGASGRGATFTILLPPTPQPNPTHTLIGKTRQTLRRPFRQGPDHRGSARTDACCRNARRRWRIGRRDSVKAEQERGERGESDANSDH